MARAKKMAESQRLKTREIVQAVRCKLTDEERQRYGIDLANANRKLEGEEGAKRATMAEIRDTLAGTKAEIARLSLAVSDGVEIRDEECVEILDFEKSKVEVRRKDTDELVSSRKMTAADRQLQVLDGDLDPGEAGENGGGAES